MVQTSVGLVSLREVFLAIGGVESRWVTTAAGDSVAELHAFAAAHPGVRVGYPPSWATCNGYSSWGWLQINWSHYPYLESVTGSTSACDWAAWLYDPVHCAQAAYGLYLGAGLSPWAPDMAGPWLQYRAQAKAALTPSTAVVSPPTDTAPPPTTRVSVAPSVVLGGAALLLVGGVVAVELGAVEAIASWKRRR
jgi:hypothetical protein